MSETSYSAEPMSAQRHIKTPVLGGIDDRLGLDMQVEV
jgi:hypothetical protein